MNPVPNNSNLIWIDLEMTGLDTDNDSILEIATVVTDSQLNILAEGPEFAIAHSLEKPEGESLATLGTPHRTVTIQIAPMQEFGAPFVSDALKGIVGPDAKIEPQNQGSGFQFTIKPRIDASISSTDEAAAICP